MEDNRIAVYGVLRHETSIAESKLRSKEYLQKRTDCYTKSKKKKPPKEGKILNKNELSHEIYYTRIYTLIHIYNTLNMIIKQNDIISVKIVIIIKSLVLVAVNVLIKD